MSILTRNKNDKPGADVAVVAPAPASPEAPTGAPVKPKGSFLTRPIGGGGGKAPRGKAAAGPQVAFVPRANLLPPEIGQNQRKRATRRGLRLMVIAVIALTLAGVAGAWFLAMTAQMNLVNAEEETAALTSERLQYADVAATQAGIREGEAALRVGGSTEIDWASYLRLLQQTLPEGVALIAVSADSADALVPYQQSEVPLEGERIGTITFTANSAVLPSIPDWINRLATMPGFADATPGSVSFEDGVYSASVTMHIDTDAYSNRFAAQTEEAAE